MILWHTHCHSVCWTTVSPARQIGKQQHRRPRWPRRRRRRWLQCDRTWRRSPTAQVSPSSGGDKQRPQRPRLPAPCDGLRGGRESLVLKPDERDDVSAQFVLNPSLSFECFMCYITLLSKSNGRVANIKQQEVYVDFLASNMYKDSII